MEMDLKMNPFQETSLQDEASGIYIFKYIYTPFIVQKIL
jgi:hypothetical protein